ncbi:ThiF family adenylyltransferase [Microcoleus sp. B7-D4]|uniref:ThiF family adenylyltransferase n=1 Tax=Microcoleus sp. B7-D4 TaxID=2818696 RepID=UPI002FCE8200
MSDTRFGRQELLFGEAGQKLIRETSVAIVGVGGIGTQVIQSLVFLGVHHFILIEPGKVKKSSQNRYIGMRHSDPVGTLKLDIAERLIRGVDPEAQVQRIEGWFPSPEAIAALQTVDVVFGCVDKEGARLKLNEECVRLGKRFIDSATEIHIKEDGGIQSYGGRVFVRWTEQVGCLVCCDVIDLREAGEDLASAEETANRGGIYGVQQNENGSGPSVVSLNAVVAGMAATEFLVGMTGIRSPNRLTIYRAERGIVSLSRDEPAQDCLVCG